jgi:hypothetical protein
MKRAIFSAIAAVMLLAGSASAQQKTTEATSKPPNVASAHPDFSGIWAFSVAIPGGALKRVEDGKTSYGTVDLSGRMPAKTAVPGASASTPKPSYKPEFQDKVKYLFDHEAKVDNVFFCGKPGVPRLGPPRQIITLPNELVFLYEDASGDPYRIVYMDGRAHDANAEPSYNGDSIGHWDGNTLVVDATNFVDNTWFGEDGYFHTQTMHVIERFWKVGDDLAYQITVDDPKVLTAPWVEAPRIIKPSTEPLLESPACVEDDAHRMDNLDHHLQR